MRIPCEDQKHLVPAFSESTPIGVYSHQSMACLSKGPHYWEISSNHQWEVSLEAWSDLSQMGQSCGHSEVCAMGIGENMKASHGG